MSACESCKLTRFVREGGQSYCIKPEANAFQLRSLASEFVKVPKRVDVEVCDHPQLREPIEKPAVGV